MEKLTLRLLIWVAKSLPQKILVQYLAKFEYASYLFYRRHSSKLSSIEDYHESSTFYELAKTEYNHYRLLCLGILNQNVDSWEDNLKRDRSCTWSTKFGEQCDNLSTKWWSLSWFFRGRLAGGFSNLETAVFTYLIEQYQAKFYETLYKKVLCHPVIKMIWLEESLNTNNFISLLANCYPDEYEKEMKKWERRKTVMWLLVILDITREFVTTNVNECLTEVNKAP